MELFILFANFVYALKSLQPLYCEFELCRKKNVIDKNKLPIRTEQQKKKPHTIHEFNVFVCANSNKTKILENALLTF